MSWIFKSESEKQDIMRDAYYESVVRQVGKSFADYHQKKYADIAPTKYDVPEAYIRSAAYYHYRDDYRAMVSFLFDSQEGAFNFAAFHNTSAAINNYNNLALPLPSEFLEEEDATWIAEDVELFIDGMEDIVSRYNEMMCEAEEKGEIIVGYDPGQDVYQAYECFKLFALTRLPSNNTENDHVLRRCLERVIALTAEGPDFLQIWSQSLKDLKDRPDLYQTALDEGLRHLGNLDYKQVEDKLSILNDIAKSLRQSDKQAILEELSIATSYWQEEAVLRKDEGKTLHQFSLLVDELVTELKDVGFGISELFNDKVKYSGVEAQSCNNNSIVYGALLRIENSSQSNVEVLVSRLHEGFSHSATNQYYMIEGDFSSKMDQIYGDAGRELYAKLKAKLG